MANLLTWREILHSVGKKVRVGVSEDQRSEFHDGDEAREVEDLRIRISAIENAGEVKQLRPLVDFGPKSLFESFFSRSYDGSFFDKVQVGKDANDFGKSVGLEDVEEFERFL